MIIASCVGVENTVVASTVYFYGTQEVAKAEKQESLVKHVPWRLSLFIPLR